jgi:hypothetical protein
MALRKPLNLLSSSCVVLAIRLDKDDLRASPNVFEIGDHFTPSEELLRAISG